MQNVSYNTKFALSQMSLKVANNNVSVIKSYSSSMFQTSVLSETKNQLNSFRFSDFLKDNYAKKDNDKIKNSSNLHEQLGVFSIPIKTPAPMVTQTIKSEANQSKNYTKLENNSTTYKPQRNDSYQDENANISSRIENAKKSEQLETETKNISKETTNKKSEVLEDKKNKITTRDNDSLSVKQKQQALKQFKEQISTEKGLHDNDTTTIESSKGSNNLSLKHNRKSVDTKQVNKKEESISSINDKIKSNKLSLAIKKTKKVSNEDNSKKASLVKREEDIESVEKSQSKTLAKATESKTDKKGDKNSLIADGDNQQLTSTKITTTAVAHSLGELAIKASLQKKAKLKNGRLVNKDIILSQKDQMIKKTSVNTEKSLINNLKNVSRETKNNSVSEKGKEFSSAKDSIKDDIPHVVSEAKSLKTNIMKAATSALLLNQKMESQILQKFESLINRSKILIKNQKNVKLTANLYPKELGKVSLTVSMHEGIISGKFLVDNDAVLKVLNEKMQALASNLSSTDFSLDKFEVSLRQNGNESSSQEKREPSSGSFSHGDANEAKLTSFEKYNQKIKVKDSIYA